MDVLWTLRTVSENPKHVFSRPELNTPMNLDVNLSMHAVVAMRYSQSVNLLGEGYSYETK